MDKMSDDFARSDVGLEYEAQSMGVPFMVCALRGVGGHSAGSYPGSLVP